MASYTVFAIYEDNHQRFATTVEAESPEAAEEQAQACAPAPLVVAGVVEGRVLAVDEDPETRVAGVPCNPGVWVNVYSITRHYGGPEEGGWWFNSGEVVASTHADNEEEAQTLRETCMANFKELEWGNIYSVNGGVQIQVNIEDHPGKAWPETTPHYE